MGVLSNLEPQKVFYYFEEITRIPHGSGNVEQISDYLVEFARSRNLEVIQDALKNVIIFKEATPGYEAEPAVILQGHMDMVAVKEPGCPKDMRTEGLQVAVDGDRIYAEHTSLGGDDGIAVAYALALLDAQDIPHPRLEVVITVDEEVGMDGARGIELSMLQGNRLVNLDSEEEGVFLTGCAGGARVNCKLSMKKEPCAGTVCSLYIGGLLGGHSGEEIQKERGNSNSLFGRVLRALSKSYPVRLIHVEGGLADNAIPRETRAELLFSPDCGNCQKHSENMEKFGIPEMLEKLKNEIAAELASKDPGFTMRWEFGGSEEKTAALSVEDTRRAAAMLTGLPNGVQNMSADMPGLVETSLNLGILKLEEEGLTAEFSVRSSIESARDALIEKLGAITELAGGTVSVSGVYPGWKYRADSPLREKMIRVYREMYGREPRVEAIHAGLECGLLGSKIHDLDCVSIGPDMQAIHTTEETLSISSSRRVWEYLLRLLAEKEAGQS
ncbi:MAG: aminoacyl-histidine dipeptidase [Acetatifactor sp.]|nr:aminoacyl-histidine dipeptidase [Acetatifactor sp.]